MDMVFPKKKKRSDADVLQNRGMPELSGGFEMYRIWCSRRCREAVRWYRLAAEQGNADAQFTLGLMYEKGKGVPEDDVLAHMWWNLSASMGNDDAAERRDRVAGKMTPAQIQEAHQLARECVKRNYKGC